MKPYRRKGYWIVAVLLMLSIGAFSYYHWEQAGLPGDWKQPAHLLAFLYMTTLLWAAHTNKTFYASMRELARFKAVVVVPIYNEDPLTFAKMLESLDNQTRRPDYVYITDDGSQSADAKEVYEAWQEQTSIPSKYYYQDNAGKREAQARAFKATPSADIYITIDSDTVLDSKAIENGLMPFVDPRVTSVGGLLLGLNYKANLLTRLVDIGFVSSFLNGRAAWSRVNSVAVNCGGLAFYRGSVVHKYLDEYLEQTVSGKKVTSGDDRIMTNFALLEGYAVFQENSIGYTLLPSRMSHLTKQRIRWWRSFFWGGIWLIRRFPASRLIWWMVTWQFAAFVMYTAIIPIVLILSPIANQHIPIAFFGYIFLLSYVRNARYLSLKRPDQSLFQQILIYLLSPLSTLLHMYLCTVLQYVGLATFKTTGWSTRKKVEVTA